MPGQICRAAPFARRSVRDCAAAMWREAVAAAGIRSSIGTCRSKALKSCAFSTMPWIRRGISRQHNHRDDSEPMSEAGATPTPPDRRCRRATAATRARRQSRGGDARTRGTRREQDLCARPRGPRGGAACSRRTRRASGRPRRTRGHRQPTRRRHGYRTAEELPRRPRERAQG